VSTASIASHGNAAVIFGNADFENSGVLSATDTSVNTSSNPIEDEGSAVLDITGATFVNKAGGLIETGQNFGSGLIAIGAATDFTNDGTLSTLNPATSTGGTIDIAAFAGQRHDRDQRGWAGHAGDRNQQHPDHRFYRCRHSEP
jgi:hypothetical protein